MNRKEFSLMVLVACLIAMLIIGVTMIVKVDRTCSEFVEIANEIKHSQEDLALHMDAIDAWLVEEEERDTAAEQAAANQMAACVGKDAPAEEIDLELIARVVAAEARGESLEGQMAVAQVIKDRSDLWGKSPEEIVLAPAQFADPYGGEIPETTWDAVESVFLDGERVFSEPVTHFYAYEICSPYWAEVKVSRGKIGGHEFLF